MALILRSKSDTKSIVLVQFYLRVKYKPKIHRVWFDLGAKGPQYTEEG